MVVVDGGSTHGSGDSVAINCKRYRESSELKISVVGVNGGVPLPVLIVNAWTRAAAAAAAATAAAATAARDVDRRHDGGYVAPGHVPVLQYPHRVYRRRDKAIGAMGDGLVAHRLWIGGRLATAHECRVGVSELYTAATTRVVCARGPLEQPIAWSDRAEHRVADHADDTGGAKIGSQIISQRQRGRAALLSLPDPEHHERQHDHYDDQHKDRGPGRRLPERALRRRRIEGGEVPTRRVVR